VLVTEWRLDMKHQKASGQQQIYHGLFCPALYSWWISNNFATCPAMKVPKFRHLSSAEAAATADDVSYCYCPISRGLGGYVASHLPLSEPESHISGLFTRQVPVRPVINYSGLNTYTILRSWEFSLFYL
jgi:hypothetical protein